MNVARSAEGSRCVRGGRKERERGGGGKKKIEEARCQLTPYVCTFLSVPLVMLLVLLRGGAANTTAVVLRGGLAVLVHPGVCSVGRQYAGYRNNTAVTRGEERRYQTKHTTGHNSITYCLVGLLTLREFNLPFLSATPRTVPLQQDSVFFSCLPAQCTPLSFCMYVYLYQFTPPLTKS